MPVVSALFAQMDSRKQIIVLCSASGIVLYLIYISRFCEGWLGLLCYSLRRSHCVLTSIWMLFVRGSESLTDFFILGLDF